jgi:beta-lactam-binding protein with PASTA domain
MAGFRAFIFSKAFLRHGAAALGILLVVVFGLSFYLAAYTDHGESVTVPELKGLTAAEILTVADTVDLELIVIDSVYSSDVPKGTVADQDPSAGASVKSGRKVYITMNAMLPQQVKMPNLIDLTFRQAKARIESYGLKLGNLEYVPDLAENAVLGQKVNGRNMKAGAYVSKGARIDLVLGNGLSNAKVLVPYVINMTLDSARMVLLEAYFNIGAIMIDTPFSDTSAVRVYRQSPGFMIDRPIPMGSTVDLFLTQNVGNIEFDPTLYGLHKVYNDSLMNRTGDQDGTDATD